MKKIRWGIAGPGGIARKFGEAIGNVSEAELCAVASTSKERAEKFAGEFNVPNVFSSYEDMAKSDCVDAVYISTAHPFHKPCAEIFIKNRKHVLCEKPICVNTKQAEELSTLAKTYGVFLMEAMWTRFLPAIEKMKEFIALGEIGEVMSLSADFCYNIEYDEDPKVFENSLAGGALLDVGVYTLHFASEIFGKDAEKIFSMANEACGVDCHTQMLLGYRGGKSAALSCATKLEKPADAYIYGTDGAIHIPDFYKADRLVIQKNGAKQTILCPYDGNGFEGEIREACICINNGALESKTVPHSESIAIMKQMDIIRHQIGVVYPFDNM